MIEELKALAEKATPGPWKNDHDEYAGHYNISTNSPATGAESIAQVHYVANKPGGRGEADAALIVALVNNIPAILSALEAVPVMKEAGQFLLARLDELEWLDGQLEDTARDYMGHVDPAIARFRQALAALRETHHLVPKATHTVVVRDKLYALEKRHD
jgi:hypothetical protein